MVAVDVITQEVIRARLDGIVREMQAAVLRTGFSTIIRESNDFSAAVLDRDGRTVGQDSPLPPHLGAYPECVQGILRLYDYDEMEEGDCFVINHPYYSGCAHPNDMVVVMPVFYEGGVVAFCASMGHKSDIGGQSPGSRNTGARDIFGEGLMIMPVKLLSRRELVKETEHFLRANSRTPDLVLGDLGAQAGALWSIGTQRLNTLLDQYGKDVVLGAFDQVGSHTEARVRAAIETWPDGVYEGEAVVDDIADPTNPLRVHVAAIKEGNRLTLDFSGSSDQSKGPINVRPPFTRGMAYYAAVAMIDPALPNNFGLANAIECKFRPGSLLDPIFPAPVGFYSTTMASIEDAIFNAMSKAAGRPAIAHNAAGGMVVIGNVSGGGRPYVQYELLIAGNGAHDGGDGWTGTGHSRAGGAKYTSIEILESEFEVELNHFGLVPDSGGDGKFRGGAAIRREYVVRADSRYAGGGGRNLVPPQGVEGGLAGRSGRITINPDTPEEAVHIGLLSNLALKPGDVVRVVTGSAGGVGPPRERDPERVARDLRNGIVTPQTARDVYGLSDDAIAEAMKV